MQQNSGTRAGYSAQRPSHRSQHITSAPVTQQREWIGECEDDESDADIWPHRLPTSTRRYDLPIRQGDTRVQVHAQQIQRIPLRGSAPSATNVPRSSPQAPTTTQRRPHRGVRLHMVWWIGCGMLVTVIAWIVLETGLSWWQSAQDDWHYGRPRTASYDVVVGNGDSTAHPTHFIALNLHARVMIIELPGGNPAKSRIYTGPTMYGANADLFPVTLTFRDVNGDGLLDMIINIQGMQVVYLNQHGQFVPQVPQTWEEDSSHVSERRGLNEPVNTRPGHI